MSRKILTYFVVTLLLILILPPISAIVDLKGFPRDTPINLQFPCRTSDGGVCETSYNCFLTMQYPNSSIAFNNFNLSRVSSSSAYYNITLPPSIPIGDYNNVEVVCTNGLLNGTESYQFTVRGAGSTPTTTEGIIYMIVVLISTLVLGLCLWGIIKIRGGNTIDEDGSVLNVNNLKYLKILLAGLAYTMLIILSYFGMNISYAFLSFDLATSIFQWLFTILMSAVLPFMAILFIYIVIKFIKDLKIKNALNLGGNYYE